MIFLNRDRTKAIGVEGVRPGGYTSEGFAFIRVVRDGESITLPLTKREVGMLISELEAARNEC